MMRSGQETYKPPIVISVHGILTAARWQKDLGDTLSKYGLKHRAYDFGHFGLHSFFWSPARQKKINKFYEFYGRLVIESGLQIVQDDYLSRPSIIAHSFGTYIVGYAMQKYPDIRFDKVILCGSILPIEFDWPTLFHRDQVNFVRNEYGPQDFWTSIVGSVVDGTGASGTDGFQSLSRVVTQERFEYFKHSDYFRGQHIESHWVPLLNKHPSPLQIRHGRNMYDDLEQFVATLNATSKIDDRCYSYLPEYEKSKIPRGLSTSWIAINPDIYTFLFNRQTDEVCGYVNAMPVHDECFEGLKAGTVRDNAITDSCVVPFLQDQSIKLYLMSVVIEPMLRRASHGLLQEPLERLIGGLIAKLYFYAVVHRIKVTEVVSVGWTEAGRKLCEALGMVRIGHDADGHPIYHLYLGSLSLSQGRAIFPSVVKLSEVYREMAASHNDC